MRRFHSYGPVNCKYHFCVRRQDLVDRCTSFIVGDEDQGGHYFTVWAPRQSGKTWLMRQVEEKIQKQYNDRFQLGTMSMQGIVLKEDEPEDIFLNKVPLLFLETFGLNLGEAPKDWESFKLLFYGSKGLFNRQVILFIDEFDSLPPKVIDRLVTLFRDMYLKRDSYLLHGLALIGVRAALGVESERGSPFNIQRSLHVPNFTRAEVEDLFNQYVKESGQQIASDVVAEVYDATRGQPGLVGWFGELITEKYNPGKDNVIDMAIWEDAYHAACNIEWNNTVLNLIKKAKGKYLSAVLGLFARSDTLFSLDADWCSFLYLNGVIDQETIVDAKGKRASICRFSSPFVQHRLYNALTHDLVGDHMPILALDPLDILEDVFEGPDLDVPALLHRYKDYLRRLKAKGLNPWKDQPRRTDVHLTEAVGHFHLYAWLQAAVGRRCIVSPEFPTGNGKVDLHLKCGDKQAIIEVKSFIDATEAKSARIQAARYAKGLGMGKVAVAMFVPVENEDILRKLSEEEEIETVKVTVEAISWA